MNRGRSGLIVQLETVQLAEDARLKQVTNHAAVLPPRAMSKKTMGLVAFSLLVVSVMLVPRLVESKIKFWCKRCKQDNYLILPVWWCDQGVKE